MLVLGEGGARLLAFVASFWLARELGPSSYGLITIGMTVLTWALWPSDLGLVQIGLRETALPHERRRLPLGAIFRLRLMLGLLSTLLTGLILLVVVERQEVLLISLLFLASVVPTIMQSEWYFQGKRRYGAIAVIRYLFGGLYLLGVVLLVRGEEDVMAVPVLYGGAIVVAALAAFFLHRRDDPPWGRVSGEESQGWRDVLRLSLPVGTGGLLVQGVQILPPLVLAIVATDETVGYFGAAFRLVLAAMIVDRIFIALYFPRITALHAEGPERFAAGLRRVYLPILVGAFLFSLLLSLFSEPLTLFLYGEAYTEAATALAILAWFAFGSIMTSFFSYPLLAVGIERAYFRSSLISTLVTAVLIVVLSLSSGLLGASTALAVGEVLTALLMYREFRRGVGLRLLVGRNG